MTDRAGPVGRNAWVSPDFHAAFGLVLVVALVSLRVRGGGAHASERLLFCWWAGDAVLRGAATRGAVAGALALA